MGRCTSIPGKPSPVNIQLPGGAKISSMASGTQQVPNSMDPFQSVLDGAQPALGAIRPVFDIVGFVMKLMNLIILLNKVTGSLMAAVAPGNPFSALFKVDNMRDDDGEEIVPPVPDFPGLAPALIDAVAGAIGGALKVAGLVPQLSTAVSIKDSVLTAMSFADAAMAQTNSLTDLFDSLPAADTGLSEIDDILQCAADNSLAQLEHKLGPLSNLVPLLSILSLLADAAAQPLPSVIYDMAKLMAATPSDGGLGILQFPDLSPVGPSPDKQRDDFLALIEELTISGLPIEIPDFSDLSKLGELLNNLRQKVEPIVPAIELVQSVFDKLTEA